MHRNSLRKTSLESMEAEIEGLLAWNTSSMMRRKSPRSR